MHGTDVYGPLECVRTNCKETCPVWKLYQHLQREYLHSISIAILGSSVSLPASVVFRYARVSEEKWRVVMLSHQSRNGNSHSCSRYSNKPLLFLVIHGVNWWNHHFRCLFISSHDMLLHLRYMGQRCFLPCENILLKLFVSCHPVDFEWHLLLRRLCFNTMKHSTNFSPNQESGMAMLESLP